jgi:hypothetical protein
LWPRGARRSGKMTTGRATRLIKTSMHLIDI